MEGQVQITTVVRGVWGVFAIRLWHFYGASIPGLKNGSVHNRRRADSGILNA
jgi:hypothetical protein